MSINSKRSILKLEDSTFNPNVTLFEYEGTEGISELYEYHLKIYSPNALDENPLYGQGVHFSIQTPRSKNVTHRYGVIIAVKALHRGANAPHKYNGRIYVLTLRPSVWQFNLRLLNRVWQKVSIHNIIDAFFETHKIVDCTFNVASGQAAFNKVQDQFVQYHESDWSFISRLLREAGLFFYFEFNDKAMK